MKTYFNDLTTAVVLCITTLAHSCNSKSINDNQQKKFGQPIPCNVVTQSKALQEKRSINPILADGTASETDDDASKEVHLEGLDTELQEVNNLLPLNTSIPNNTIKLDINPMNKASSKEELERIESKYRKEVRDQEEKIKNFKNEKNRIKNKISALQGVDFYLAGEDEDIKDKIEKLFVALEKEEKELKSVNSKKDKTIKEAGNLHKKLASSASDKEKVEINSLYNGISNHFNKLEEFAENYCKLKENITELKGKV